jgi:hypothetical protein
VHVYPCTTLFSVIYSPFFPFQVIHLFFPTASLNRCCAPQYIFVVITLSFPTGCVVPSCSIIPCALRASVWVCPYIYITNSKLE